MRRSRALVMAGAFAVLALLVGALAIAVPSITHAAPTTRYVYASCTGSTTPQPCYTTINGAITAASAGDIIKVAAGTYNEQVDITKPITLEGAQAGNDARTRFNGGAFDRSKESILNFASGAITGSGYDITDNSGGQIVIDGFTIENGNGFAVSLTVIPAPVIGHTAPSFDFKNNIVQNSVAGMHIYNYDDASTIEQNEFYNISGNDPIFAANSGYEASRVNVVNNTFEDNAEGGGADISLFGVIEHWVISGNRSVNDPTFVNLGQVLGATVENNTILDNNNGTAIYFAGGDTEVSVKGNTITGLGTSASPRGIRVSLYPGSGYGPNTDVTITGNKITGENYGIYVGDGSGDTVLIGPGKGVGGVTITGNSIYQNLTDGLYVDKNANEDPSSASVPVLATCNYWGSASGPDSADNTSGKGDKITGSATDKPFLTGATAGCGTTGTGLSGNGGTNAPQTAQAPGQSTGQQGAGQASGSGSTASGASASHASAKNAGAPVNLAVLAGLIVVFFSLVAGGALMFTRRRGQA